MELTAFKAGPRRDPMSRMEHLRALSETGRTIQPAANLSNTENLHGSGLVQRPGNPNSWETDVIAHAQPQPIDATQTLKALNDPVFDGMKPAGSASPHLGLFAMHLGGPMTSQHYHHQTAGFTEEDRRNFLMTGERHRRHAGRRQQSTNTIFGEDPASAQDRWQTSSHTSHSYHSAYIPRY